MRSQRFKVHVVGQSATFTIHPSLARRAGLLTWERVLFKAGPAMLQDRVNQKRAPTSLMAAPCVWMPVICDAGTELSATLRSHTRRFYSAGSPARLAHFHETNGHGSDSVQLRTVSQPSYFSMNWLVFGSFSASVLSRTRGVIEIQTKTMKWMWATLLTTTAQPVKRSSQINTGGSTCIPTLTRLKYSPHLDFNKDWKLIEINDTLDLSRLLLMVNRIYWKWLNEDDLCGRWKWI